MDRGKLFVETARQMGVPLETLEESRLFMLALSYAEEKIRTGDTDHVIVKRLGINQTELASIKSAKIRKGNGSVTSYETIASSVLLEAYLSDRYRDDVRSKIFADFHAYFPLSIENMLRISAGKPARDSSWVPAPKDQIAAFATLQQSPLAQAYVSNLFMGSQETPQEIEHLRQRQVLLQEPEVFNLDFPIEGEIVQEEQSGKKQASTLPPEP